MPTTFTHADLPADAALDALAAAGFEAEPATASTLVVLDTFDGRLHDAGLRLLARRSPDLDLVLVDSGGGPSAHLAVPELPDRAADLPPGPFRARVEALTAERALLPLLTITSRRQVATRRDKRGKTVGTVIVHRELRVAESTEHGPPAWGAEVIEATGHGDVYQGSLHSLRAAGLTETPGDLIDGVARAVGIELAGRTSSPTVALQRSEPAFDAVRRVLLNLADTIDANLAGTIADTDPEFLHELRVAVRRTRSVLSQTTGVLPDDVRATYRDAFGWLGTLTSPARDLDVQMLEWDDQVAPLPDGAADALRPVRAQVERRRRAAHRTLAKGLQSARYTTLMHDWRAWLTEPQEPPPAGEAPIGPTIARRITKAQRRLLEHGRAITPESPPEHLHDLRKDAKKLRYLIECFGSLLPAKPRKAFVRRLKELQDNLGQHQDAEVHVAHLHELAAQLNSRQSVDTDALLAMGQLTAQLDQRRLDERAAFAERFAAYDTKATRRALDALLKKAATG
jgi:CHAD domain-containing protein